MEQSDLIGLLVTISVCILIPYYTVYGYKIAENEFDNRKELLLGLIPLYLVVRRLVDTWQGLY